MTSAPRCSVIMPAYNVEDFIGEAIESVLRQTISDWELIVVDDGSTDQTVKVAQSFKDNRLRLIQQKNAGVSSARNRGFAECQGIFVTFLDADDRLHSSALERLLAALEPDLNACAAYGNAIMIKESGKPFSNYKRTIFGSRPSGYVLLCLLRSNFIVNGAILVRARCFEKSKGFRIDLRMAEDWELWCRLAMIGDFLFIGHDPILEYRIRKGSAARIEGIQINRHWLAIESVFNSPQIRSLGERLDLRCLKRKRMSEAHYFVGIEFIRYRKWNDARHHFMNSLRLNYMNPKVFILLFCSIQRWIPKAIAKRIGC